MPRQPLCKKKEKKTTRINYDDFELEVSDLISKVENDKDKYPRTYSFLENSMMTNEIAEDASLLLSFAEQLMDCEPALPVQEDVAVFLNNLLLDIVENENNEIGLRAECANTLGAGYYDGRIGEQNYDKAAELYEFAAANGNAHAQENLGYVWYYGRTGGKDYEKAFNYFVKGALNGMPTSMYKLGDMYRNGYYVEKDPVHAFSDSDVFPMCRGYQHNGRRLSQYPVL